MNGLFHLLLNGVYWGDITHWSKPLIPTSNGTSKWFLLRGMFFGMSFFLSTFQLPLPNVFQEKTKTISKICIKTKSIHKQISSNIQIHLYIKHAWLQIHVVAWLKKELQYNIGTAVCTNKQYWKLLNTQIHNRLQITPATIFFNKKVPWPHDFNRDVWKRDVHLGVFQMGRKNQL